MWFATFSEDVCLDQTYAIYMEVVSWYHHCIASACVVILIRNIIMTNISR